MAGQGCSSGGLLISFNGTEIPTDQLLSRSESSVAPVIKWPGADASKTYALAMVDPDHPKPSDPKERYWRHWLLLDIPGQSLPAGFNGGKAPTGSKVVTGYTGPCPPAGPPHRYQFSLYEQKGPSKDTLKGLPAADTPRNAWNLDHFLSNNSLGPQLRASFQFKSHSVDRRGTF